MFSRGMTTSLFHPGKHLARAAIFMLGCVLLCGCATLPPGARFPKVSSVALSHPEETQLGRRFNKEAQQHSDTSGFRILSVGVDGFLARIEMVNAAERTLDLQYYIFRGDESGRLLSDALLRAADRGVRVRVLVDDGETIAGDEQIMTLSGHPNVEIRVFNPFAYRGHAKVLRSLEFVFNASRLDYRMHNKLLVVDNAAALVGGRNIGNQYFQIDPESQFADDDVFAAGPVVTQLSASFDEYWNSSLSIPAEALGKQQHAADGSHGRLTRAEKAARPWKAAGIDIPSRLANGKPFSGMLSGELPLVWAHAQVVCDSPDKKHVVNGDKPGRLMAEPIAVAARSTNDELLMVTPYFVPTPDEMQLLKDLRLRNASVRILTSSLEASSMLAAQSGYRHFRVPLLQEGVELYEVRSRLGNSRGSGQNAKLSRYGNYRLHAKLFVFDRRKLFIGSMNFDQRSKRLNTEVGLIIDSAELAKQTALRFEAMTQLENAYALSLRSSKAKGAPHLVWVTREHGETIERDREPARDGWQRFKYEMLSLVPLSPEL